MKIPRIAIIDDGINLDYIPQGIPFEHYEVYEGVVKLAVASKDSTHGTACYYMFCNYFKSKHHLVSIKVLDDELRTGSRNTLLAALNWCVRKNIDLIHMSIGTRQYLDFEPISEVIKKLQKTIIVAACSNRNIITFPACLPTVIGVRHCNIEELKGKFAYISTPHDQIEMITYSESCSNSMAAPIISAHVCNYLAQGYSGLKVVRQKLKEDAVQDTSFLSYSFYKGLLSEWEELQVPVVAIPDDILDMSKGLEKLKFLIKAFVQDGYRAICLSTTLETNVEALLFQITWQEEQVSLPDLIKLYYNFTMPDIIFLHMDIQQAFSNPGSMKPDVVITEDMLKLDTENLFGKIKGLLS